MYIDKKANAWATAMYTTFLKMPCSGTDQQLLRLQQLHPTLTEAGSCRDCKVGQAC
jgi:hypothetical protein